MLQCYALKQKELQSGDECVDIEIHEYLGLRIINVDDSIRQPKSHDKIPSILIIISSCSDDIHHALYMTWVVPHLCLKRITRPQHQL